MARTKKELTINDIPLGEYETDLTWMAYRYAIGRHTIAACMMAHDMAKHLYDRMSEERKEFTAYDIRREIASTLSYSEMNFSLDWSISQDKYKPLELFAEYFIKNNIHAKSDIEQISHIRVSYEHGEYIYDVSKREVRPRNSLCISNMNVEDLIGWMNLANALDSKSHKRCKLIDGTECEYIESFYIEYSNDSLFNFVKIRIPLDNYVHGNGNQIIPDESIEQDNI